MTPRRVVVTNKIADDLFLNIDVRINECDAIHSWCSINTTIPAAQTHNDTSVAHEPQGYRTPPQVTGIKRPVVEATKSIMPIQSTSQSLAKKSPCR
jgi:hypothetical protein